MQKEQEAFNLLSLNSKSNLQLDSLTKNNIGQLKVILKHSGEVYEEKKCEDWLQMESQLGYFNDLCVAGIVSKQTGHAIEILFCVVLKAYQKQGLGTLLVKDLIKKKREFKPSLLETQPTEIKIKAHKETIPFWEKMGFSARKDMMVIKI